MVRHSSRRLLGALALASTMLAGPAFATDGYFQAGYGTVQKAEAGAGVANPQDAMALSINPAGLVDLPHMLTGGISLFMPDRGYTATGTTLVGPSLGALGVNNVPVTNKSGNGIFALPHFAYSVPIDADTALGLALYGNGGSNTSYGNVANAAFGPAQSPLCPGGAFCGGAAGQDLKQIFITAGFAKRFGSLSVGVAPVLAIQTFKANGLALFGFPPPFPGFPTTFSSNPFNLSNNGTSWSWGGGVRAGVEWKVTPAFRIGLSGSTPLWMSPFSGYTGLFADGGKFNIPANITAGVAFDVLPTLTLMAEYKRIFYSGVGSIANSGVGLIRPIPTGLPGAPGQGLLLGSIGGPGFGWRDVDVFTVAGEWRVTPSLALRAGYSHNNNPVPWQQVTFNILAPGVVTDHFTGGFGYKINENSSFDVSAMFAPRHTVTGPEMTPFGYTPNSAIKIGLSEFELSFGYSYKFGSAPKAVVAKY